MSAICPNTPVIVNGYTELIVHLCANCKLLMRDQIVSIDIVVAVSSINPDDSVPVDRWISLEMPFDANNKFSFRSEIVAIDVGVTIRPASRRIGFIAIVHPDDDIPPYSWANLASSNRTDWELGVCVQIVSVDILVITGGSRILPDNIVAIDRRNALPMTLRANRKLCMAGEIISIDIGIGVRVAPILPHDDVTVDVRPRLIATCSAYGKLRLSVKIIAIDIVASVSTVAPNDYRVVSLGLPLLC
jgi:hypothetical protein